MSERMITRTTTRNRNNEEALLGSYDDWLLPSVGQLKYVRDQLRNELANLETNMGESEQDLADNLKDFKKRLETLFSEGGDSGEENKYVCAFFGESGAGKSFLINVLLLLTMVDKFEYSSTIKKMSTAEPTKSRISEVLPNDDNLVRETCPSTKIDAKSFYDVISDFNEDRIEDSSFLLPSKSMGDATTNQTIRIKYGEVVSLLIVYESVEWAKEQIKNFLDDLGVYSGRNIGNLDDSKTSDDTKLIFERYANLIGWKVEDLKIKLFERAERSAFPEEICEQAMKFMGKSYLYDGRGSNLDEDILYVKKVLDEKCGLTNDENMSWRHLIKSVTLLVPSELLQGGLEILDVPGTNHNDSLNRYLQRKALNRSNMVICCVDVEKNLATSDSVISALGRSDFPGLIQNYPRKHVFVVATISDRRPTRTSQRDLNNLRIFVSEKGNFKTILSKNQAAVMNLFPTMRLASSRPDSGVSSFSSTKDEKTSIGHILHVSPRIFAAKMVESICEKTRGRNNPLADMDDVQGLTNFDRLLSLVSFFGALPKRTGMLLIINGVKQQLMKPTTVVQQLPDFLERIKPNIVSWGKRGELKNLLDNLTGPIDRRLKAEFAKIEADTSQIHLKEWAKNASNSYKDKAKRKNWTPVLWAEVTNSIKGQNENLDLHEILFGGDIFARSNYFNLEQLRDSLVEKYKRVIKETILNILPLNMADVVPGLTSQNDKTLFVTFWQEQVFPNDDIVGAHIDALISRLQHDTIYKKVRGLKIENLWKCLEKAKDLCVQDVITEMRKKNLRSEEERRSTRGRAATGGQDWNDIHEDISSYIEAKLPEKLLKKFKDTVDGLLNNAERAIRDLMLRAGLSIRTLRLIMMRFIEHLNKQANANDTFPGKYQKLADKLEKWKSFLQRPYQEKNGKYCPDVNAMIHFLDSSVRQDKSDGADIEKSVNNLNITGKRIDIPARNCNPKVFPNFLREKEDHSGWFPGIEDDSMYDLIEKYGLVFVESTKSELSLFEALAFAIFETDEAIRVHMLKKYCVLHILRNLVPKMSNTEESVYLDLWNYLDKHLDSFVEKLLEDNNEDDISRSSKFPSRSETKSESSMFSPQEMEALLGIASEALHVKLVVVYFKNSTLFQQTIETGQQPAPAIHLFYLGDNLWKLILSGGEGAKRSPKKSRVQQRDGDKENDVEFRVTSSSWNTDADAREPPTKNPRLQNDGQDDQFGFGVFRNL